MPDNLCMTMAAASKSKQAHPKKGSTSNKYSLASKNFWLPLPIKSSRADLLAYLAEHNFLDAGRSTASLNTASATVFKAA